MLKTVTTRPRPLSPAVRRKRPRQGESEAYHYTEVRELPLYRGTWVVGRQLRGGRRKDKVWNDGQHGPVTRTGVRGGGWLSRRIMGASLDDVTQRFLTLGSLTPHRQLGMHGRHAKSHAHDAVASQSATLKTLTKPTPVDHSKNRLQYFGCHYVPRYTGQAEHSPPDLCWPVFRE